MFRVEYLFGMSPRFGSILIGGNQHDNVGYYLDRDKKDFANLEDAQKFFEKLENTWETEPIYEKDRFEKKGVPHYLEIVLKNFDGNKWNILKKSTYDDWFKANKERKFQEYDAQHASNNDEEPAGIMENKQIKLNENEFRSLIEGKVRGILREMFEGATQPGSISHGTMRPIDLIPTFMNILKKEAPQRAQEILQNYPDLDEALTALEGGVEDEAYFDSEEAVEVLNNEIWDAMQEIAPEGHYFGSHPGDGSDYGYWPSDDEEPALTVDDEELYENKKHLNESQFRRIVENKVRGMLKEMFEVKDPNYTSGVDDDGLRHIQCSQCGNDCIEQPDGSYECQVCGHDGYVGEETPIQESQFRKIVENKVREVLKESFGGLDQMFDTESELDDEPIQQPTGYIIVNNEGKGWTNNGMYGQPAWTYQLDATEFGSVTVYKSPVAAKRIADKIGGTVREY